MNNCDMQCLQGLLKGRTLDKARIITYNYIYYFTSEAELIQYLSGIGYPKEGSCILLKDGAWISWTCHSAGQEYYHSWELYERPSW
jgi:hypothetical protein